MSLFRFLIKFRRVILFILLSSQIFFFTPSSAQEKTNDSLALTMTAKHRANRAALLSAVVPGAGQILILHSFAGWIIELQYRLSSIFQKQL